MKYSADEIENRRQLFKTELKRVVEHNQKGLSWKEGINKFSAMTTAERKAYHGRSKGVAAKSKDLKAQKTLEEIGYQIRSLSDLPASVDWREKGIVSPVKDQGHCGSCWAFAATATVESYVAKNTGLMFSLSPEQIAMCAPNPASCGGTGGCEGATAEIAFDYLSDSAGFYEEFQYPYVSYDGTDQSCNTDAVASITSPKATIDGFVKLPENNYTALMSAIATTGPMSISVDASSWHAYEEGVYDGCNQVNPDIDHAVVLVGYGTCSQCGQDYWLIRNSWSASFGEAGYIKIARKSNEEEICGSDVTPQDGSACEGQTDPVTVCGTCGVLYDSSYPLNAGLV
jgi:cathepsin L